MILCVFMESKMESYERHEFFIDIFNATNGKQVVQLVSGQ
jgi:hypothetical protein